MPIYREHPAAEGRRLSESSAYLLDVKHAAPGEKHGHKTDFYGTVNGLASSWKSTNSEMAALEASYGGGGEIFTHASFSLRKGEKFTPAQAQQAAEIYLKHQGMEGHLALWSVHKDTDHHHIHILACRIAPEPSDSGKYGIAYTGGSIVNPKSGHTYTHLSGHAAEAEIRARQGWQREAKAKFDFVDGQIVRSVYQKNPADVDKIKVGSRVEAAQAHTGKKHAKTLLGERSRDIIRAAGGDTPAALTALTAAKISYKDVDYLDAKGRRHTGGLLTSADCPKGIKLSSLPKDCQFLSNKNSKDNIPTYAPLHTTLSNVNAQSKIMHAEEVKHASNIQQTPLAGVARAVLEKAKEAGKTEAETEKAMQDNGIAMTRETTADKKTGRPFTYLKFSRAGEQPISLRALGLDDAGKPIFTLPALEKQWAKADLTAARKTLATEAAAILDRSSSWAEAEKGMAAAGIAYSRVKAMITDKSGEEKEVIVGRLEKDGVTTTTSHAGREYAPAAIDARYMPYAQAKDLYAQARQQSNPVGYLAAQGLTVSDIDRIGRVGEKAEKGLQRNEKSDSAPAIQAPVPSIQKSIIPNNINEIIELIAESATQAAALASANAAAARAQILANRADARAEKAEAALAALKASIKHEEKKTPASAGEPAPEGAKEAIMAMGSDGAKTASEILALGEEEVMDMDMDMDAAAVEAKLRELLPEAEPLTAEVVDLYGPVVDAESAWTYDQPDYDDDDDHGDGDRM